MAVIPDTDRIRKYSDKLQGDLLSPRVAQLKAEMVRKVTMRFAEAVQVEDAVKAILDEETISTTQYPFYIAFGRQVYKAKRRFGGTSLIFNVNIYLSRWVADGFNQTILERIRDTIFTISAPGP